MGRLIILCRLVIRLQHGLGLRRGRPQICRGPLRPTSHSNLQISTATLGLVRLRRGTAEALEGLYRQHRCFLVQALVTDHR